MKKHCNLIAFYLLISLLVGCVQTLQNPASLPEVNLPAPSAVEGTDWTYELQLHFRNPNRQIFIMEPRTENGNIPHDKSIAWAAVNALSDGPRDDSTGAQAVIPTSLAFERVEISGNVCNVYFAGSLPSPDEVDVDFFEEETDFIVMRAALAATVTALHNQNVLLNEGETESDINMDRLIQYIDVFINGQQFGYKFRPLGLQRTAGTLLDAFVASVVQNADTSPENIRLNPTESRVVQYYLPDDSNQYLVSHVKEDLTYERGLSNQQAIMMLIENYADMAQDSPHHRAFKELVLTDCKITGTKPLSDTVEEPTVTTEVYGNIEYTTEVDNRAPNPDDIVTHTLTLTNIGQTTAPTPTVKYTQPQLTELEYSIDGGRTYAPWTGSVELSDIPSGGTATVLIRGRFNQQSVCVNLYLEKPDFDFDEKMVYGALAYTVTGYCPRSVGVRIFMDGEPIRPKDVLKNADTISNDEYLFTREHFKASIGQNIRLHLPGANSLMFTDYEVCVPAENAYEASVRARAFLNARPPIPAVSFPFLDESDLIGAVRQGNRVVVNMKAGFYEKLSAYVQNGSGSPDQDDRARFFLYAFVNSLCELPNVGSVTLLENGQRILQEIGGISLSDELFYNPGLSALMNEFNKL